MGSGASKSPNNDGDKLATIKARPKKKQGGLTDQDAKLAIKAKAVREANRPILSATSQRSLVWSEDPRYDNGKLAPKPSKLAKADIFGENADRVQRLDAHAGRVPLSLSIQSDKGPFVDYLTRPAKNSLEKVRLIFYWLSTVNLNDLNSETVPPAGSIQDHLLKIKFRISIYAVLFHLLCKLAQVPSVIIAGMNKSAAYEVGESINRKHMSAYWNAVYINNEWRLIDCFWASTCLPKDEYYHKTHPQAKKQKPNEDDEPTKANSKPQRPNRDSHGSPRRYWNLLESDATQVLMALKSSKTAEADKASRPRPVGRSPSSKTKTDDQLDLDQELDDLPQSDSGIESPNEWAGNNGKNPQWRQRQINEFYFLTDPEKLVYSHLPDDPRWQLLAHPVSASQFEQSAYATDQFHRQMRMRVERNSEKCVIYTNTGSVKLSFGLDIVASASLRFKYTFYQVRRKTLADTKRINSTQPQRKDCLADKGIQLERHVFLDKTSGQLHINIRCPSKGTYKIHLFGYNSKFPNNRETVEPSPRLEDNMVTFHLLCTYVIECTHVAVNGEPLPDNPILGWGPQLHRHHWLIPITHHHAVIKLDGVDERQDKDKDKDDDDDDDEQFLYDIRMQFEMRADRLVYVKLLHNSYTPDALSRYVLRQVVQPDAKIGRKYRQLILWVRLPHDGEYALELFAKEHIDQDDSAIENCCNYLIQCTRQTAAHGQPFPTVNGNIVGRNFLGGPDLQLTMMGLEERWPPVVEPQIIPAAPEPDNELKPKMQNRPVPLAVVMHCNGDELIPFWVPADLILALHITHKYLSDEFLQEHVSITREGNAIQLRLPCRGEYGLNVYARKRNSPSQLYSVTNYVLIVDDASAKPFCTASQFAPHLKPNRAPFEDTLIAPNGHLKADVALPNEADSNNNDYAAELSMANEREVVDCQLNLYRAPDQSLGVTSEILGDKEHQLTVFEIKPNGSMRPFRRSRVLPVTMVDDYRPELKAQSIDASTQPLPKTAATEQTVETATSPIPGLMPNRVPTPRTAVVTRRPPQQAPVSQSMPADMPTTPPQLPPVTILDGPEQRLRHQMTHALKNRDYERIRRLLDEAKRRAVPHMDDLIEQAKRLLQLRELKQRLNAAMAARKLAELEAAIDQASNINDHSLRVQLMYALKLRDRLRHLQNLNRHIIDLDHRLIAEMKSYLRPPSEVLHIMQATFLMLGNATDQVQSWRQVQQLLMKMGREGVKWRVATYEVDRCPEDVAATVRQMLSHYSLEDVNEVSIGASAFYIWSLGMADEVFKRLT